jgi:hypothetical protein
MKYPEYNPDVTSSKAILICSFFKGTNKNYEMVVLEEII